MDTVNNIAAAASKAIWGDASPEEKKAAEQAALGQPVGQEPISGELGDVKAGEPYDKGNAGEPSTTSDPTSKDESSNDTGASLSHRPKEETTTSSTGEPTTSTFTMAPPDPNPNAATAATSLDPHQDTEKTGVVSATTHDPAAAATSDKPSSSTKITGPNPDPTSPDYKAPSLTARVESKEQGAEKPGYTPSGGESERIRETKKEAEEAANIDTSGPGPKPLKGKARSGVSADGEDDGPQKESHGEGTGEKYIKSSGVKADGGDFDAANPGAGKEADRLLESKGIHREAPSTSSPKDDTSSTSKDSKDGTEVKEKLSLKEKIKAKLHRN